MSARPGDSQIGDDEHPPGIPLERDYGVESFTERTALDKPPAMLSMSGESLPKFDARGASVLTLAVLATLFALQAAAHFIIPMLMAILLAYALDPLVSFLERRHVVRPLGALVVIVVLLAACCMSVYALRFQAQSIVDQIPNVVKKMSRVVDAFDSGQGLGLENVRRAADALQKATDQATGEQKGGTVVVVQQPGTRVKDLLITGSRQVLEFLGQLMMVIFLVYFILITGDKFKRKFVKLAGRTLSEKKITVQMFDQINQSIQRYMAMLFVTNLVVAVLSWGSFRVIGLENAGTWGVVAGVFHLVPYFGPVLTAVITGGAALMQFGSLSMAGLVGGVSLVIATLVGVVLTTWMTGRIAKMNTVAIFIALLLFGWLWGVAGVLLSVPIVVIIKVVSDHVEDLKALSEFLSD